MELNLEPVKVDLQIETPSLERGAFYNLCFITENDLAPRTLEVKTLSDLLENGYTRLDLAYNFCVGVFSQQGIDTVYIRAKRSSESYVEAYNSDDNSKYYFVVLQTKDLTEIEKFNSHLVSSDEMKLQFFSQNVGSKTLQSPKLVNYYQDYTFSGEASVGIKDYYLNKAYDGVTVDSKIPLPDYLLGGYGNTAVDYGVRMMVGEDYVWEIDKEGRRIRYAPSSTPSPVENWEYLPIYDVAVQVKRNSIAGHAESIEAVNNSLPFVIPNYEPDVTITGIAKVGEILSTTVTDKNGVPSNINYQWYADGEVISDAITDTYVIKESDSGKTLTVQADFTDKDGFSESVTDTIDVAVVVDAGDIGLREDYSGTGWYKATDTGTVFNKDVPALETHVFSDSPTEYVSVYTQEDAKSYGERAAVSNITDMQYLFVGDVNFNQDISSWDVSNVTNMIGMFGGAANFNQDISSWDVSSVLYMSEMFQDAANFNQDISSWDVSNVITMEMMFMRAYSFNQDISSWNVSSVITMRRIFYQTGSFNQDISPWNVSSVIDMSDMFYGAHSFNQDISPWNVSNVENMSGMFACDIFNQDLSEWCVELVSEKPQSGFDLGENPAWALPKPVWGTCPRGEAG